MNNLEKLITDLSNYWDLSPEKVVDRLNHMNESEIKKVVNKMTKKFKKGGMIDCLRHGGSMKECGCGAKVEKAAEGVRITQPYVTTSDTLRTPSFTRIVQNIRVREPKSMFPQGYDPRSTSGGKVIEERNGIKDSSYFTIPDIYLRDNDKVIPYGTNNDSVSKSNFEKLVSDYNLKFAEGGVASNNTDDKHEYHRPSRMEEMIGSLSKAKKHDRRDGLSGYYKGEIRHNGDTVTTVVGPYSQFEEIRTPKGERYINQYTKTDSNRMYVPGSSSAGWFRRAAPAPFIEMFDEIRKRFK